VTVRRNRFDETWHRLRDWNGGQTKSEMLAWQVVAAAGYTRIDPAHPHGGPDGGRDAMCERDGEKWVMAAYFPPSGQQTPAKIKKKLLHDIKGAKAHGAAGIAFVTNQEITLADREDWEQLDPELKVELFHLLRVTQILNEPQYAQTREEFLDIIGGPPAMLIKASVVGTTHAFTDDTELLDRFVWMREKAIRKRSDEGHARVRAEREAKVRAEQDKRAREAAEKAREEATKRLTAGRPWDISIAAGPPRFNDILGTSPLMDALTKDTRSTLSAHRILGIEPPKPPKPLSEEQIQEKVARYRAELEARWPACRDYLASVAWPALRLRIGNEAESFLNDVEVILTFHGARGIDFEGLAAFEFEKVQDPSWKPPSDPRFGPVTVPMPRLAHPSDYPVDWRHNDDGDLEVTVTLSRLRPFPEWRSEKHRDDIVLVVNPDVDIDEITVTYTATAHGYGKAFVGDPFTIPAEKVAMLDVLKGALGATEEAS
jgi:hypothetical protein